MEAEFILELHKSNLSTITTDAKSFAKQETVEPLLELEVRITDLVNHVSGIKESTEVSVKNGLSQAKTDLDGMFVKVSEKNQKWVTEQLDERVDFVTKYLSTIVADIKVDYEGVQRDVILIKQNINNHK